MAYTYDDFVTAANKAGLMNRFSQKDLDTAQKSPEYGLSMLSLIQDGDKATTAEQRLLTTEAVNQLRKNYGIYDSNAGTYAASEGSSIQGTMQEIENYGPFAYDPEKDSSFVDYRAAALRESKRATEDTIAKAAASTGGVASTAAIAAAQQAADYYNSKIADASSSFEQTAYQRYLNGLGALENKLAMLQQQDAIDYERYLQEEALKQQNAQMLQQSEEAERQRLIEQAEMLALSGDYSGYKALGMTDDWIAKMQNAWLVENTVTADPDDPADPEESSGMAGNAGVNWTAPLNNVPTAPGRRPVLTNAMMQNYLNNAGIQGTSPNMNGDGTFTVGGQTMTVDELAAKVTSGEIIETIDPVTGAHSYQWRSAGRVTNGVNEGGIRGQIMRTAAYI